MYFDASKMTLVASLRDWVEKAVKPPMRRPETYRVYTSIIENHIAKSPIANLLIQKVRGTDLERYYATLTASPRTVTVHHTVIHRALKKATKERTGARKRELHGLTWDAIDLDAGAVTIRRQLDRAGAVPVFGPTKTDRTSTVSFGGRDRGPATGSQAHAGCTQDAQPHHLFGLRAGLRQGARRPEG